jgi:hypothetical protein
MVGKTDKKQQKAVFPTIRVHQDLAKICVRILIGLRRSFAESLPNHRTSEPRTKGVCKQEKVLAGVSQLPTTA